MADTFFDFLEKNSELEDTEFLKKWNETKAANQSKQALLPGFSPPTTGEINDEDALSLLRQYRPLKNIESFKDPKAFPPRPPGRENPALDINDLAKRSFNIGTGAAGILGSGASGPIGALLGAYTVYDALGRKDPPGYLSGENVTNLVGGGLSRFANFPGKGLAKWATVHNIIGPLARGAAEGAITSTAGALANKAAYGTDIPPDQIGMGTLFGLLGGIPSALLAHGAQHAGHFKAEEFKDAYPFINDTPEDLLGGVSKSAAAHDFDYNDLLIRQAQNQQDHLNLNELEKKIKNRGAPDTLLSMVDAQRQKLNQETVSITNDLGKIKTKFQGTGFIDDPAIREIFTDQKKFADYFGHKVQALTKASLRPNNTQSIRDSVKEIKKLAEFSKAATGSDVPVKRAFISDFIRGFSGDEIEVGGKVIKEDIKTAVQKTQLEIFRQLFSTDKKMFEDLVQVADALDKIKQIEKQKPNIRLGSTTAFGTIYTHLSDLLPSHIVDSIMTGKEGLGSIPGAVKRIAELYKNPLSGQAIGQFASREISKAIGRSEVEQKKKENEDRVIFNTLQKMQGIGWTPPR